VFRQDYRPDPADHPPQFGRELPATAVPKDARGV
jgi:hypothetical protein